MASALAEAHIAAQARLREIAGRAVERIWHELPGHDREDVDQWLSRVLPVVATSQRASAALTEAYLARFLGRQPRGVAASAHGARARAGAPPEAVYRRPFVTLWKGLGEGRPFEEASAAALARATSTAAMDVQLAMRETASAVQEADDAIFGYERVANAGACAFCAEIDGAYVKSADAFPLHNGCGCGLEPLTEPHSLAAYLPTGEAVRGDVAFREHGELGLVLGDPSHDFTHEEDF